MRLRAGARTIGLVGCAQAWLWMAWVGCNTPYVEENRDADPPDSTTSVIDAADVITADAADVSPGDAADGAAASYCSQLVPPAAPANFLCVDFDGPEVATGWTKTTTDGGAGSFVTTAFSSPPQSLLLSTTGSPQISWRVAGATAVQAFSLDVKINPFAVAGIEGFTGRIELASIRTAQVALSIGLRAGGEIDADWYYENGGAMGGVFTVPPVPANVWTTFTMKSSAAGGNQPALLMNGVMIGATDFGAWTDTAVTVTIGMKPIGQTIGKQMRFDDVVAKISRTN